MDDPSPSARAAALRRLAGDGSPAAISLLCERLDDPHPYVRRACAGVLGGVLDPRLRARIRKTLRRARRPRPRAEICRAYALWADETGLSCLQAALKDKASAVRLAGLRAVVGLLDADGREQSGLEEKGLAPGGPTGRTSAWRAIEGLVGDRDPEVAAEALAALPPPPLVGPEAAAHAKYLRAAWAHTDARVRMAALESSVVAVGETAVFAVARGLTDAVWSVRLAAAELSGADRHRRVLGDVRVVAALIPALEDERLIVRQAVHEALVHLTGIPFEARPERWRAWLAADGAKFDFGAREEASQRPFERRADTVAGPRFYGMRVDSRHVAFVLDASGSMRDPAASGAQRWAVVQTELARVLKGLRGAGGKARVNVHLFSDEVTTLYRGAVPLTKARALEIERRLAGHQPAGRTALYDGVARALEDPEIDTVVVLSDGAPSSGSFFTKTDLLAELALRNRWRRARIHVVAIGRDGIAKRWRNLLKKLASQSGGTYVSRR